jgi:hypothetical protein
VPSFATPEECHAILERLLRNDAERRLIADRLRERTMREYEDRAQIRVLADALCRPGAGRRPPVAVPAWYWRLAVRHKIRPLARSPLMILRELCYLWEAAGTLGISRRLGLVAETCLWIPWHYFSRVLARARTVVSR